MYSPSRWSARGGPSPVDANDLYQEVLLDHFRHPRNHGTLADGEVLADEENPNCGDRIRLAVRLAPDGTVADIRFDGRGCAISTASASIMTAHARGRPAGELSDLADRFSAMMRAEIPFEEGGVEDLAALAGVRSFPLRVKCATMAWHALKKALARAAEKPFSGRS